MFKFNEVEQIIGYEFNNKNLLMQAFMRRSYGIESGAYSDNEVLEFVGDRVIDYVLVRCMMSQYARFYGVNCFENMFQCSCKEGTLNRILVHYKEGDYLANRLYALRLDKYALCGKGDEFTFDAAGDTMEAIIAAVAMDCDWNYSVIEELVERLLNIHLEESDITQDSFNILNSWHKRHFMDDPVYDVFQEENHKFICHVTIKIPDSNKLYCIEGYPQLTRSRARSSAAQAAYDYLNEQGVWMNLKESLIEPNLENAINQLQELYQKGYVASPEYETEKDGRDWVVSCRVGSRCTLQRSRTKIFAKKKAAYAELMEILKASDLAEASWELCLFENLGDELLNFYKQNPDAELEDVNSFILKCMNTYDVLIPGRDHVDQAGKYHRLLQKELCRQMGIPEEAFVEWKRKSFLSI